MVARHPLPRRISVGESWLFMCSQRCTGRPSGLPQLAVQIGPPMDADVTGDVEVIDRIHGMVPPKVRTAGAAVRSRCG